MTNRATIQTNNAPMAIGTYSQAIKVNNTVYLSGQIPLDPSVMQLVETDIENQICQVLENLQAVCSAAGGDLNCLVKLNVFLTNLDNFSLVNKAMEKYFAKPYPARAAIGVAALPMDAAVEMDGIMVI
ncbi:MAG: reactive intermediate/imine deaminase [Porticoccaceae bacterium]|nr:reactive intermediate/imine deaminase [Porticoccaceae bacterium]